MELIYDSEAFVALNAAKAEAVERCVLPGSDGSELNSQYFGLRGGIWRAPFSAPFSVAATDYAVDEFYAAARRRLGGVLRLAWAPDCYGISAPRHLGTVVDEANFHYPLERVVDYRRWLSRSARYNLNLSLRQGFEFEHTADAAAAYEVIAANRQAMGYPLAMSLQQVLETVKVVPADFFLVRQGADAAAAAMVYRVGGGFAQLIYWGDLPRWRHAKVMNFMAWQLAAWYAGNAPGIHTLDLGPASADGVRNEGLCQFKLSIGAIETAKAIITIP